MNVERPERPTIAELREVTQPATIRGRRTAEHWTGDLYMRRVSPYLTRLLLRAGLSANAVTALMIVSGAASGFALLVPGLAGAVLAVALTQLQMLWDASDGEVARWRRTSSPLGIFLDRVGHYLAESLIPIALGVRAAGGLDDLSDGYGWTTLGALLAVVIVLNKSLNDMVHVSRAAAGLAKAPDDEATTAPRSGGLARLRRLARFLPFHRLYHSIELSLLVLVAAVVDVVIGDLTGTRVLLTVLLPAALLAVAGHFLAIVSSSRLRP
ncbi:CDP-alcohol phosphatidyltransferase [Blastococcus aurantiacus]|uniref:CDP-alcohol phosphatidyltransferase n=1 Tax=Blastococcus aurantiacus TaxID=1550231 RepID=A0A1G7PQJ1_9ACTN|nr:CDP-alcohol phosphatidyltransferase family protein [Blastococcus aurantiacus]SDF88481.1 CDP-alcohol phosphatidyltransferase [Blastococcus aurantiacus]